MPAVPAPAAAAPAPLPTPLPTSALHLQPAVSGPAVIDANEPTLEEKPVRVEDLSEDHDGHTPVTRGRVLRARKKGAPAPRRAPAHRMPEIDPAAWLADEAHARTSDRGDSADGVDNSDTIVAAPRPTHYV